MEITTERKIGFRFWLKWCLSTAMGLGLGHFGILILAFSNRDISLLAYLNTLFGVIVGVGQWLLMRKTGLRMNWWPVASGLGWAVGGILFFPFNGMGTNGVVFYASLIVVGLPSLCVMRGRWFQNVLYIVACGGGWFVAFQTAMSMLLKSAFEEMTDRIKGTVYRTSNFQDLLFLLMIGICAGAIFGIFTGGPIVWILRQKQQNAS